jgi:pyrimidine operon attenuation protein/uracil phosphoribosyltransferase
VATLARSPSRIVCDAAAIDAALDALAASVIAGDGDLDQTALIGVHTAGVPLARRLQKRIFERTGHRLPLGMIDITLYRDDSLLGLPQPVVGATELPFEVSGSRVVLVDDVLFTGRTTRAALDAIIDFGRPRRIELLVLCERGHRELPIQADHVGVRVDTDLGETVKVELLELGAAEDRVAIYEVSGLGGHP